MSFLDKPTLSADNGSFFQKNLLYLIIVTTACHIHIEKLSIIRSPGVIIQTRENMPHLQHFYKSIFYFFRMHLILIESVVRVIGFFP